MSNNCKDNNGNDINQFVFGDDGIVYGLINYDGTEVYEGNTLPYDGDGDLIHLNYECCSNLNFMFNSDNGRCYYREQVANKDFKLVFNVEGNNGVILTKNDNEDCQLSINFKYLLEYDSNELYNEYSTNNQRMIDILNQLSLTVLLESYEFIEEDGVYESNKTLVTLVESPLRNDGITVVGTNKLIIGNILSNELGNNYNSSMINSDWVNFDLLITNEQTINSLLNKELKISVLVSNSITDFSFLIDDIKITKTTIKEYTEKRTLDKSPSFNLERVIDNKKSWSNNNEHIYNSEYRPTNYTVDDDRLIINSKEIDLTLSSSNAVSIDLVKYIKDNPSLLNGYSSDQEHTSINLSNYLDNNILDSSDSEIIKKIISNLIDAKSLKTSITYPTLIMLYERYLNAFDFTGIESNGYDINSIDDFKNMLGNYWYDLVEQVVPATTIWNSSDTIKNIDFIDNKYVYNKYNLYYCNRENEENISSTNDVSVVVTNLNGDDFSDEVCDNIYIKSFDNGGMTYGNVTISENGV